MRRDRDRLPKDRVQWNSERTLWGEVRSTLAQGDSMIYPFTVYQARRVKALQARAGRLGLRVRAVTDLVHNKLYVWVEEALTRRAPKPSNVTRLRQAVQRGAR